MADNLFHMHYNVPVFLYIQFSSVNSVTQKLCNDMLGG